MQPLRVLRYRLWTRHGRGRRWLSTALALTALLAFVVLFDAPEMGYSLEGFVPSNATILVTLHTVPRPGVAYLSRALRSLRREVDAFARLMQTLHASDRYQAPEVSVLVVNHRPNEHPDFEHCRQKYPGYLFVDSHAQEPAPMCAGGCPGLWREVTEDTVRMNFHIIEWLKVTQAHCTDLFLIAEDDFDFCPDFFSRARVVIAAAQAVDANFGAIRVSYGMNGVVLNCKDLAPMIDYLQVNQRAGPADTLYGYLWTATQRVKDSAHIPDVSLFANRSYFVVRNNLMQHFGKVSSRSPKDWAEEAKLRAKGTELRYPQCDDILNYQGLYALESFNPEECNMALCRRKNDVIIDSRDKIPRWIIRKYKYV